MKSRAPQLHLEYRFYKQLGQAGRVSLYFRSWKTQSSWIAIVVRRGSSASVLLRTVRKVQRARPGTPRAESGGFVWSLREEVHSEDRSDDRHPTCKFTVVLSRTSPVRVLMLGRIFDRRSDFKDGVRPLEAFDLQRREARKLSHRKADLEEEANHPHHRLWTGKGIYRSRHPQAHSVQGTQESHWNCSIHEHQHPPWKRSALCSASVK